MTNSINLKRKAARLEQSPRFNPTMEREAVLHHVLGCAEQEVSGLEAGILEERLAKLAGYAKRGQAQVGINLIINEPLFVDLSSDLPTPDLLTLARVELNSRLHQSIYFRRLKDEVRLAQNPADMVLLTDVYAFLRLWSRQSQTVRPMTYIDLFTTMMDQANTLCRPAKKKNKQPSPDQLVDFMLPAVQSFVNNEALADVYTWGPRAYLVSYLPARFVPGSPGHMAACRISSIIA